MPFNTMLVFRSLVALFVLGLFTSTAQPQEGHWQARADKAVKLIESNYSENQPGISYLLSVNGKVLRSGGIGMANLEWGIPMTDKTVLRLGSMSKPLTAVAVLKLVEQGKLDLDTPVANYSRDLPPHMGKVTLRELLSHRSGLKDHAFDEALIPLVWQPLSTVQIIETQAAKPPGFEPGAAYEYVNFNYVIGAHVIEAITGKSFVEFSNETMFRANGMDASAYDQPAAIIPGRAEFFDGSKNPIQHAADVDLSHVSAAGALLSSVTDMSLWLNMLVDGKLINPAMLELAWTPAKLPNGEATAYGLGFNVSEIHGEPYIWHTGLTPGAQGAFGYASDSEVFVILLSNLFTWPGTTGDLVDQLMTIMLTGSVPKQSP